MYSSKKSVIRLRFAVAAATLLLLCTFSVRAEFVHPGVAHSQGSIDFVKAKLAAGEQPWAEAWEKLRSSRSASLDWEPQPIAHVERGASNNPNIGSSDFSRDAGAAYTHALCWVLAGEEKHARKAAEIIAAWSGTLESISNHDARLLVGMDGYDFCVAGELLKHTWDGWAIEAQEEFGSMLRDIFYPIIENFYPSANGNWDASMLQTMAAMGVFLDDQAMFDRAVDYYLRGEGNGAIGMYFKESGQCQETGRDQGHTQMGLDFLACTCETAWIQGVDLYGALDSRLLAGFEYTAKYNLGNDVPYEPYKSFEGRYHYKRISDDARGRLRPMYEKVFNHYHNRKGMDAPFTEEAALKLRERSRGRERGRRSRSSSALGTLMFSGHPSSFEAGRKVVCFGDSITKRGYPAILGELIGVSAVNAGVGGHSSSQGLHRITADVLDHNPDVVVVFFGTNDIRVDSERAYVPLEKYKANLKSIVEKCRGAGASVVLCSLPPIEEEAYFTRHERGLYAEAGGLNKLIGQYRGAAMEVAKSHEIPLVDLNKLLLESPEWLSPDGVHPNKKGTRIIAGHVAEAVAPLIAQKVSSAEAPPARARSTSGVSAQK